MDDGSPPYFDTLPEELIELVKPELEPGERLLWASRPGSRALKKETGNFSAEIAVWAVGLVILGVACLVGNKFASDDRYPGVSALLLTVAVISGVASFLIILGWLSNAFSASERATLANQVYALTDQRAIIKTTDAKSQAVTIHSFHRGTIKPEHLHRIQYPDGSGDVNFQEAYRTPPGFLDVAEVRRVEGLIRRFLIASEARSTP
jgi:hypothetical protein